jgi:hypothetical protein
MNETHITVLTGQKPSLKVYTIVDDIAQKGDVETSYYFDYVTHAINNIDQLFGVIKQASLNDKGVIIRGKTDYPQGQKVRRLVKDEGRPDGTFYDSPTAWICIDFDEKIVPDNLNRLSLKAVEWLINAYLPPEFHNTSYIYQWSASAGLEYNGQPVKNGTNIHLFFYFDKGLSQPELKSWFRDNKNIDRSVFGIVQPIFVNANVVKDDGIIDLIPSNQKIGLVKKENAFVATPEIEVLEHFKQKYNHQVSSIDGETSNAIIRKLYEVGCVTHKSPSTLSLKSPHEKTQGGYYTKIDNPLWIHHGGKGSRRVDQWLQEEWHVDFQLPVLANDEDLESLVQKFKKKQGKKQLPEAEFLIDQPDFAEAYHRHKRHEMTQKAYKRWKRLGQNVKMLLYAFEGFGKSRIVHILVQDGRKVIFACKTNEQAEEQHAKFFEQGLRVQLVLSREYQLSKRGYAACVVKDPKKHPWDVSTINESATLARLRQRGLTKEEAQIVWSSTGTEKINWADHDVILMTHARLALLGFIQEQKRTNQNHDVRHFDMYEKIPLYVDCVWDDVDKKDFAWLSPFDNQYASVQINGKPIETKTITKTTKGKHEYNNVYFVKPECFRYGYGLPNRQIFSTTEQLTTFLIERHIGDENLFVPELMPEIKMKAGDITVFKTQMTGRNRDGLLLPLLRRVNKEGYEFHIIGDGISRINHTNNKGQNCFDDKDIVVEVSQMNLTDIQQWLDELGWTDKETHALKVLDALDRLHQAVGRNSGYRWSDKEDKDKKSVVVLLDGGIFDAVVKQSRYYIDCTEDLDTPNRSTYRKRPKDSLANCIAWYIQNLDNYINSIGFKGYKKRFEQDCRFVVDNYEQKFIDRMKLALDFLSTSTKNTTIKAKIDSVVHDLFIKV